MALAVAAPIATGRTRRGRPMARSARAKSVSAIAVIDSPLALASASEPDAAHAPDSFRILLAGVERGPYSAEHVRHLARTGEIYPTDPVSLGGHSWQPAGQAKGIYSRKDWVTALCLALFLGILGADRFYLGHTRIGFAKLALGWATLGVWPVLDTIAIARRHMHDGHGRPLR